MCIRDRSLESPRIYRNKMVKTSITVISYLHVAYCSSHEFLHQSNINRSMHMLVLYSRTMNNPHRKLAIVNGSHILSCTQPSREEDRRRVENMKWPQVSFILFYCFFFNKQTYEVWQQLYNCESVTLWSMWWYKNNLP